MKLIAAIIAAGAICISGHAASAKELKLLSSWDANYAYNPYLLDTFIQGIEARTNGRITISVNGPETVPPFEQLEPVAAGVFDFLFTSGSYHSGTTPIMTIVEAIESTPQALHENGLFDHLDAHYQTHGLKLISAPVTPYGAYHYIMRNPINSEGDWAGSKIRGVLTHKAVIEMLGGSLVVIPPSDVYTGLEKGVIDGAVWPAVGIYENGWHEVAKHLLRPRMGTNYNPIFMNLASWQALSSEDQQAITETAREIEQKWYETAPTLWQKEEDSLVSVGVTLSEMGEDQKAKLRKAWSDGLWALGAEIDSKSAELLKQFASEKGLLVE